MSHSPKPKRVISGVSALSATALLLGSAFIPSAGAADNTVASQPASVPQSQSAPVTDRIIVKFNDKVEDDKKERADVYNDAENESDVSLKEVKTTSDGAKVVSVEEDLSAGETAELVEELNANPSVEYAEPDTLMQTAFRTNDSYFMGQWFLYSGTAGMNIPDAWSKSKGNGQVIAVIDTGITPHSDLNANVLPGYDMISTTDIARDGNGRDANPNDEGDWIQAGECGSATASNSSWHGTHVAGTIAAVTGNSKGVTGVAPGAKILPVRALGACGGYTSGIADAITWASGGIVYGIPANKTPARIINLSLGGNGTCSATTQQAINGAVKRGSAVFVAAGNSNQSADLSAPANCENVIVVAASTRDGYRAPYSNYGSRVDITAPGGDLRVGNSGGIISTVNTGTKSPVAEGYDYKQGTSMATPQAAAVGALILANNPSMSPAALEAHLKVTARPLPGACPGGCGAGLIDAAKAVGVKPVSNAAPTIAGTTKVGNKLSAATGTWGPAPVTLKYQWYRSGVAITGATGTSYVLSSADLGKNISVKVTGSKTGYTTVSRTSAATSVVTTGTMKYASPTLSGTTKVGYTLTANTGTWTSGTSFKYQWYRSGVAIKGATSSKYTLGAADRGKKMTVKLTGSKAGYNTVIRNSAASATVATGTLKTATPTISGTAKVGYTLKVNRGTWTSGTAFKYQWYRSGVAIKGATGTSYKLVSADRYDTMQVRVQGSKSGYASAYRWSAKTAKVK